MFGKKRFLWMLLTATTMAAQTEDKDNKPLRDVSSANLDAPQRPRIVYRPHGIQVAAPFPARRNWPQNPPRPRPGAYPPGVGFDPRRRISDPRLSPGYPPLRNGQAFGPGIQMATAPLPARRNWPQHPPRPRPGAYPPGVGFDPRFPRISGPQFPPGYPPLRNGQAFGPVWPKDPWFGLPTPLGPYSQRRPVQPPTNLKPQVPLAPLQDLDGVQSTVASNSNETLKWHPDDTWRGAQRGRVAPPAPAELHALVPHYLRVEGPRNNDSNLPDSEEVGYVDEMPPEDSGPQYSAETDRHTIQNTPPSPRFITRGQLQRGSPSRPPPPLLADDDALFHDDAALFHDDAALFHDDAALFHDDAALLSDDAADDRTPRVVRATTFDPLLLL